jgi:hypothetical protein
MQSPVKETIEISLTELPRAPEDHGNPSYQHHIPQFGVGGGIHSVFQYTAPEAGSQQIKPLTPTTLIKQRALQERVL